MTALTNFQCEKKYSYQHIQGTMLVNFNKVAYELNLSHSEFRLMVTLIGLWNKNKGMAFPTIDYLAKYSRMGKATIIKNLTHLVKLNLLIVVKSKKKRNNYYFSNLLFDTKNSSPVKLPNSSPCKTIHEQEQIKIKTDKNKTLSKKQNDNDFKTPNISDYRELLNKLNNWGYSGAKKLLKQKSIEEIKKLIELVENQNPSNKGAYLRALINTSGIMNHLENKSLNSNPNDTQINQMLKYQYWKHLPTDKIYKVKPDIGSHLLVRYYKNENMVELLEYGLIERLDKFEIVQ